MLKETTSAKLELGDFGHEFLLLPRDLLQQVLHAQHPLHLYWSGRTCLVAAALGECLLCYSRAYQQYPETIALHLFKITSPWSTCLNASGVAKFEERPEVPCSGLVRWQAHGHGAEGCIADIIDGNNGSTFTRRQNRTRGHSNGIAR